jgi:hypothetical protein
MRKLKPRDISIQKSRYFLPMLTVWFMLALSMTPSVLLFTASTPSLRASRSGFIGKLFLIGPTYFAIKTWYSDNVYPVQEMRVLASFPATWDGRLLDVNKNYARFERWYGDHLGLRDMMIRTKNEVDYRLFRSSSRVYFGKDNYIYGRHLVDFELPATETILNSPDDVEAVHRGLVSYAEKLQAEGVTPVFVTPMQKEYLVPDNLPFFAPRLPQKSKFMSLYDSLKNDSEVHFIDVFGILQSLRKQYPIYYKQDFHWTDMSALEVAKETTNLIAKLERSSVRWEHPIQVQYISTVGSDARFSARLDIKEKNLEPELIQSWKSVHKQNKLDFAQTGLEFDTDMLNRPDLLPPTCMYGNSFSDGMLQAGLTDYYQKFTKLDRARPLSSVPELVKGRCKYVIIQILDIQTAHWSSLRQ